MVRKKPKKNQQTHFPGDPRYGVQERVIRQDVGALIHGRMLNTRLLNCLIQRAAPPPAAKSSDKVLLGSLAVRSYMAANNALFEDTTGGTSTYKEKKIAKIRSRLEHVFDLHNDCVNRLIVPVVEDVHFFVFVVDFNQACPDFFINVHFYDSLRRSTRASANLPSDSSEIVAEVNDFLCNFVLHRPEHNHLQRAHYEVLEKLKYQECPQQLNGIDCGLFCVGVVLHILDGKTIDRDAFSKEHVTELRFKLGNHFMGSQHNRSNEPNHEPTSKVVRDCFPSLRGTTIVSEYGVEDVTPLHIPADVDTTATRASIRNITTVMTMTTTVEILNERKIDSFVALEDVDPFIEEYEEKSGNQLSIKRGERNSFRLYVCKEHIDCTFQIFVGRRRGDGMYLVKRVISEHSSVRRQPRALDGRRHKKRRANKLDEMIVKVRNMKKERPTPADVIKTAATQSGEVVPYIAAWRALQRESGAQSQVERKKIVCGRQAGRPKENRIRHRSECIRPEDSKIKCGQCGQKGHNKRTCKNEEVNLYL
ncbi:hypothetical protein MHU86_13072 [Fragilaria crotonensis]|nr:hypothetical protein MHU86_17687 [Fragilaria crotonensis]KAI2501405.1 hypothetical protein MHU86_13072 [Fragilaria crotonensis]